MKKEIKKSRLFFLVPEILLLLILIGYSIWLEPYQIDVRHLYIKDAGIEKVLAGKTAVQLSDLHMNSIGRREEKILDIIEDLKPDLIFLTGDYVKWKGDYEPALTFFSRLKANMGIWAVMGDYDYSCSKKSCLFCHEQGSGKPTQRHKVRFLRNQVERIKLPDGYIWFGAIDKEGEPDFISDQEFDFMKDKIPSIILSHSPLVFDSIDKDTNVFILAGDTHGGQIRLPRWLWLIMGYEKCARYNQGLFWEGRKKMYVSRGIGTSHFPIRFLNPPEVAVFHF